MVKFIVLGKQYDSDTVCFTFGHLSDLFIETRRKNDPVQSCGGTDYEKGEIEFSKMTKDNTFLPGFKIPVDKGGYTSLRRAKKTVFEIFATENKIPMSILHDN